MTETVRSGGVKKSPINNYKKIHLKYEDIQRKKYKGNGESHVHWEICSTPYTYYEKSKINHHF